MNTLQKKILTIAAGIANIALSLAVAATATFAWFLSNNTVKGETLTVSCAQPESTVTWKILSFDAKNKVGVGSNNNSDFKLAPYDKYVPSNNEHTNVILRAEVDVEALSYTSAKQIYIDISCNDNGAFTYDDTKDTDDDGVLGDGGGVPGYSSNVTQFKASVAAYSTTSAPSTFIYTGANTAIHDESYNENYGNNDEYVSATEFFSNTNNHSKFVSLHGITPTKKNNTITAIPKFDCGANNVSKIVVYVEASYNTKLVDFYSSTHPSDSGEIALTADITDISFRVARSYTGSYVKVSSALALEEYDDSALADGTASSTSNDYLILNEHEATDFDSANYSDSINTRDVHNRAARIVNDENSFNSRWNHNTQDKLSTSDGTIYGNGSETNTLAYSDGDVVATSNGKSIKYDDTDGQTSFDYYNTSTSNLHGVQFYKYDDDAAENPTLSSISLGGVSNPEYYNLHSQFAYRGTVTAHYSDNSTLDVTQYAVFTGYNMEVLNGEETQSVTVSYTEEGITRTATHYIKVVNTPTITLDYPKLSGTVGANATITATPSNFRGSSISYSYTSATPAKVTCAEGTTAARQINFVAVTDSPVTVTVTATDSVTHETASATCQVSVRAASTVTDEITYSDLAATNTTYTDFSNVQKNTAVYAGNSAKSANNDIQMNGNQSPRGTLISTTSGGKIKSVTITWGTGNTNGRYITLYGKNEAYTAASEMYSSDTRGTSLGTITYGTSTSITVEGDYTYLGLLSCSNAIYINKITIVWEVESSYTPELVRIELTNKTTSYYVGDTYIYPTITAYYDDQSNHEVLPGDCEISGNDLSVPGTRTVTISYTEAGVECSASYDITVTTSSLISIAVTGAQVQFSVGDTFTTGDSFRVTATYAGGATANVTAHVSVDSTNVNMARTGTYTVNVSYSEGGTTANTSYQITVGSVTLSSISIKTAPTKLSYYVGDTFDPTGVVLLATYSDTSTSDVTSGFTYSPSGALAAGNTTITFSYGGKTCTQTITLYSASVSLSETSLSGLTGGSATLTPTPSGFMAGDTVSYTWESNNTSVATVSASGSPATVSYAGNGSCTITCTATAQSGKTVYATCSVTVSELTVTLSKTEMDVAVSGTNTFTFTTNGSYYSVTSSATDKATVSRSNNTITVTGVASGSSTITVRVNNGGTYASATCAVTVKAFAVTLSKASMTLTAGGDTDTFTFSSNSTQATYKSVASDDTDVATVSRSDNTITVTPVAQGSATITVTMTLGNKDASTTCSVTVNATPVSKVTITMDFYDSTKISSTSGSNVTLDYIQGQTTISNSATVSSVVKSYSASTATRCRYGMNGGVTFGTGSNSGDCTIQFDPEYAITEISAIVVKYDDITLHAGGNTTGTSISTAAGTGSPNSKGTTLANCTNTITWSLDNATYVKFASSSSKRVTLYRVTFTTIKNA